MIIIRLAGGLANQMFPYAAGRRLAHALGTELKLDVSGFEVYAKNKNLAGRKYALQVFNIEEKFAARDEVEALTVRQRGRWERMFDSVFRKSPRPAPGYFKEKYYQFDPEVLELKDGIYLSGNWNSWKYFDDVEPIIRKEFTFKNPPEAKNLELSEAIASVNSVSMHIRRGDYVANPKTSQVHGTCDLAYYNRCVAHVEKQVSDPHFFIFSDEPEWARKNIKLSWPCTFVDHNGLLNGHEDMRLMSKCKHNIIANSGFSWWAAWLNANPGKIVCAPQMWFKVTKYDTKDLIPKAWARL